MTVKRPRLVAGFTLIEIMIATVVLLIAVLGTSAFRYTAALGARKADLQTTAARMALLLCESWRGVEGIETYDPTTYFGSDLTISNCTDQKYHGLLGTVLPETFTPLGIYSVASDDVDADVDYHAFLSWKDVQPGLRALNVVVAWEPRGSEPGYQQEQKSIKIKLFKLTTYVSN
jgi:prepilin-type N-terminal cleavage/methylation domain-containing protein